MKKDYITHMVIAAFLLLVLAAFLGPKMTDAQTLRIFTPTQGGTGIGSTTAGNVGNCLKVLDDSPFTYELGTCGTGGGSGGGFPTYFQNGGATLNTATTTVNFTANSFAVTEDPTDTLIIRVATTTLGLLTTNVSEGSNLYYTDARVSSYMSGSSTYSNLISFYTTPSTRITAGTGIDWSGNTLNGVYTAGDALTLTGEDFDFDGGATPAGALGGTWASPTVDDDGHNHTGTTLSGIDISSDTNLSADGTEIVLTGDALSLGNTLSFTYGSTTGLSGTNLNFTNATVTNIFSQLASTTLFFGAGLPTCNGASNALTWSAGSFGCNSITGSDGVSNWLFNGTRLTPSTTAGIVINASSTISDLNTTNATATNLFANTTFKMGSDQFTDLTGFGLTNSSNALGILTTGAADGECLVYSSTGPTIDWVTCASGGGGGGGGWATTTDTNDDPAELVTYTSYDAYIGGSASTSAEFNFDPETAKFTISSTTASASGTILAANGGLLFGKTGETTEFNWNTANVLKLYSSTGVNVFDFGDLRSSSTLASTTNLSIHGNFHIGGDTFTDLTGSGLQNSGGALTCITASASLFGCLTSADWTSFNGRVSSTSIDTLAEIETLTSVSNILIENDIDASSELAAIMDDETGSAGSLVFSGSPTLTGLTTMTNYFATLGSTTHATSSNLFATTASTSNFYGAGLYNCTGASNKVTWSNGLFTCETDQTGAGSGDGVSNWLFNGTRLTPSSTVGIGVWASSTLSEFNSTNATITNATSTSLFSALGTFTNMIVNTLATFLNVVVTGLLDVGGGVLEIPNGTNPTSNDVGEVSHDTSDNQLIMDDYVIRTKEELYQFSIGSTSPSFVSGVTKYLPVKEDGYTVTDIYCTVEGGTNKAITIFGEAITCDVDGQADDGTITIPTVAAASTTVPVTMGATSGTVNYVNITITGTYTRE